MKTFSDFELINKAIEGDEEAFQTLVERHCSLVFRISFKWCGNMQDSEDISQEVMIKLAQNIRSFKPGQAAFTTWLYRVTVNTAKDYHKKQKSCLNRETQYAQLTEDKTVVAPQEDQLIQKQTLELINRLPIKEKEAVLLTVSEGLSYKQAAKVIGCTESTVNWRVHNARKKLKKWV